MHALCAKGIGGWLSEQHTDGVLDQEVDENNYFPYIDLPAEGGKAQVSVPGFHIMPKRYEWFGRALGRTAAAAVTAFAGDHRATAQYLTNRQGQNNFTGFAHAGAGSVRDVSHRLLGVSFTGTDHVFRLNGTRMEAFSGVAEDLFHLLENGRVSQYRREVYKRRCTWPTKTWDNNWGGPVSIHPDGTVLAIRQLP